MLRLACSIVLGAQQLLGVSIPEGGTRTSTVVARLELGLEDARAHGRDEAEGTHERWVRAAGGLDERLTPTAAPTVLVGLRVQRGRAAPALLLELHCPATGSSTRHAEAGGRPAAIAPRAGTGTGYNRPS